MLTAERVNEIFLDCLFKDHELVDGRPPEGAMVEVQGVTIRAGLCKARVEKHAAEIALLCDELPAGFKDGWSFLQMCYDRNDRQWGDHKNMQELALLACASGKMELCAPREMWPILPGGMPYYRVK